MPAKRWRSRASRSRIRPHRSGRRGLFVDCADFDALEVLAEAKMPPASWAFCAAGADDEITANENIAAWRALRLRPRVLHDVGNVDLRTSLLGAPVCRRRSWWRRPAGTNCSTRKASARPRAAPHGASAAYVMASNANVTDRGGRRRAQSRAAMVPALLLAEPRRGRGADRPAGGGRLHRAGAHGRCAGAGLVAARGARAARSRRPTSATSTCRASRWRAPPIIPTSPAR